MNDNDLDYPMPTSYSELLLKMVDEAISMGSLSCTLYKQENHGPYLMAGTLSVGLSFFDFYFEPLQFICYEVMGFIQIDPYAYEEIDVDDSNNILRRHKTWKQVKTPYVFFLLPKAFHWANKKRRPKIIKFLEKFPAWAAGIVAFIALIISLADDFVGLLDKIGVINIP